jgi:dihydropteroate synthase
MEYKDIASEVKDQINKQISRLIDSGLHESQIAIDPGLGFGKKLEDSARLLLEIEKLAGGFPLIVGYSNKKFIDSATLPKDNLLDHCYNSGVSLVRLHLDK